MNFSPNSFEEIKRIVLDTLGISFVNFHKCFLRLPIMIKKNKKWLFGDNKDKVWKKLKIWREKCLSMARKEMLLKLVVQANATYNMSCFKLPSSLCYEILMEIF